ncbi:hypothetical protein MRX96_039048 [Rhipicephalus microplus]
MDVASFYGSSELADHAKNRTRIKNKAAENLLMRIADGNTSDISLSDDEEGDQQPTQTDNQPDVAAGPSSPVDENDNNDGESTAKTRVLWTAKDTSCGQTPHSSASTMTLLQSPNPLSTF